MISIVVLKQWIVFFAHSDWLIKLRISIAIHLFTSSSTDHERVTPNSREVMSKMAFRFAMKFGLEVLTGNALSA